MLEVDGLTTRYGAITALHAVSLRVDAGEIVALVGPNGAGKTTLLNTVAGLLRPAAGTVRLDGDDVTGRDPARSRARRGWRWSRSTGGSSTISRSRRTSGWPASRRRRPTARRRLDEVRQLFGVLRQPVDDVGGLPVGWRGATAGGRQGADERPAAAAARRADARSRPDPRRRHLRPARRAPRPGTHGARRRAERRDAPCNSPIAATCCARVASWPRARARISPSAPTCSPRSSAVGE